MDSVSVDTPESVADRAYYTPANEVAAALNVNIPTGLTSEDAERRLAENGKNALEDNRGIQVHKILFHHLVNFMSAVLLGATILSIVAKEYIDAVVIGSIIILNTIIGFFQEYRSEKTMESLRKMTQPTSRVLRDGKENEIPSENIVVGDIVLLRQGDKVPADLRLLEVVGLECDEALLTGESMPIEKKVAKLDHSKQVALGDRKNLAFMSCTVTKGKGCGIVIATGLNSEIGKVASSLTSSKKQKTKLQKRMDRLGLILVIIAILAIGFVLLGGYLWKTFKIYPAGLQTGISTAVAIIPEGLVPVVTLTLTLGVRKLAQKRAIVRKIGAVESLGNITNICTDKTGTLTQGRMVATNLWVAAGRFFTATGVGFDPTQGTFQSEDGEQVSRETMPFSALLAVTIGALCNSSSLGEKVADDGSKEWTGIGSPTEVALIVLGKKLGLDKESLQTEWEFVREFPFDSSIKRMSMIYRNTKSGTYYLFLKGAPERVLARCTSIMESDNAEEPEQLLGEHHLETIHAMNDRMAHNGLRVLSLSYKKLDEVPTEELDREKIERDAIFVGLVGIQDPPREGVIRSIAVCHGAGISVHMVTGDHPSTATAIARQIGIIPPTLSDEEAAQLVTTATEFDALTESELRTKGDALPLVIARCSPESKVRMVKALHDRQKYVAMLGDGVNDSPAIKMADVGVSMGNGSDVTKEASDVILTDDDFSTIVVAIQEGRRIFANIRKFIVHLLSGNVAEAIVLVIGILVGLQPPLAPLQVLWVNMVTGTPPALALGIEAASKSLMDKNKRKVDEPLFTKDSIVDTFFYGTLMGVFTLVNFIIGYFVFNLPKESSQSISFATLTFLLMFHAYNCRDLRHSFVREGFLKSYYLHASVLFGIASLFLTFYIPFFEVKVFHHRRPDWRGWLITLGATVLFMMFSEAWKFGKSVYRRRHKKKKSAVSNQQELGSFKVVVDNQLGL